MNRKKLATIGCIILSIAFSSTLAFLFFFKVFLPIPADVYEKTLYYPEALFEEYQKEAERMIAMHEYSCQYPVQATFYSNDVWNK